MLAISMCFAYGAESGLEQAVTLARQGQYADARRALLGVAEPAETRQRIAFHRLKAAIASGLGEHQAAAGEMRAALALAPDDTQLRLAAAVAEAVIGDIEEKRGHFLEAANAYQAAVQLAPEQEGYRIELATALIKRTAFEQAVAQLKDSLAAFPKSAKLRVLLGVAEFGHGDNAEAVSDLEEAIAMEPELEGAKRCLARIVLGSAKAAPQHTVEILCAWDRTVCAALRLRTARENQDSAQEREAVAELKRAPLDNMVARCALGLAYQWRGDWNAAAGEMKSCVRLDPSPQHHYTLALIYRKLGQEELARKELALREALLKQVPEDATLSLGALQTYQQR
jgi:Tfp pilus assembly protein PilF